jgi:hypothetical protein
MKRLLFLSLILLAGLCRQASAQVQPAARGSEFGLDVGGEGSGFNPDYGPNWIYGGGLFIDLKLTRWIQGEAEGRWLRVHQFDNIYEDNYLIGPRVPIHRFWRATPYAKVLFGMGTMNFQDNYAYGRFTDIAFGGGVDLAVSKRVSFRAIDFEYQEWPSWVAGTLSPYGISVGVSYHVFGSR